MKDKDKDKDNIIDEHWTDCMLVPMDKYIGAVQECTLEESKEMLDGKLSNAKWYLHELRPDLPVLVLKIRTGGINVYKFGGKDDALIGSFLFGSRIKTEKTT